MTFQNSSGSVTVTLPGTAFGSVLPNIDHAENLIECADGTEYAYNHAVNRWFFELRLNLSESQRLALRSFILTTVQFGGSVFKLTPDAGIDLGKGAATQLTDVRYRGGSYKETPTAPGRFSVSMVLSTKSTGTSAPA